MFDIKICGGTLIDGTGNVARQADIGIIGDRITAIGSLRDSDARETIDATGKIISPGFIDFHTHSDLSVLYDSHANSKIHDGCTTEVIGNCGIGVAPVTPERKQLLIDYLGTRMIGSLPVQLEFHWETYREYLDYVNANPPSLNVAPLAAQGPIRIAEMGFAMGKANPEQLKNMREMVAQCFEDGALGLSTGLVYMPGAYTEAEELIELAKVIKPYDGFYVSHIRSEGDDMFQSLEEAIKIASAARVRLQISHMKLAGSKVKGKTEQLFSRIAQAEADGLDIMFDCYPYSAGMTSIAALFPGWVFEGGVDKLLERITVKENRERIRDECLGGLPNWQSFIKDSGDFRNIMVSTVINDSSKHLEGRTIEDIAKEMACDPFDAIFEMTRMERGRIQVVVKIMNDSDVEQIVAHPKAMYGSDGMSLSTEGLLSFGNPHPRAYGTHGIILSKFVREKKLISLESAVKKMTSMPADRLKLNHRGTVKEGFFADIIVFDADKVTDNATYAEPKQYTTGIEKVIVNGKLVLSDGVHQEVFPGKVIGK